MRVRLTPRGERQLLAVIADILADRPVAARPFRTRTLKALKRLE